MQDFSSNSDNSDKKSKQSSHPNACSDVNEQSSMDSSQEESVQKPSKGKEATNSSKSCLTHIPGFWAYLIVFIICSLAFWALQCSQSKRYAESRAAILNAFNVCMEQNREFLAIDSLSINQLCSSLNFNEFQKATITLFTNDVLNAAVNASEIKATKEGSVQLLLEEIKSLEELQLSRIEREYESMQIWYGLLTVVFLLFSFFSLYKTDDMVKSCEETFKRLNASEAEMIEKMNNSRVDIQKLQEKVSIDLNRDSKILKKELVEKNDEVMRGINDDVNKIQEKLKKLQQNIDSYQSIMDDIKNNILLFK